MAIVVGYTVLELRLPEASSLKDKRQVVKSVIERVKRRYNVSISEVAEHDSPRMALLGVSCVGQAEAGCRRTLDNVAEYIYTSRPDAEVMPHVVEIVGVG